MKIETVVESVENRLQDLETRIIFQDDIIQKLDDALAGQQQQMMDLERKILLMMNQIKEMESLPQDQSSEAPPPHY